MGKSNGEMPEELKGLHRKITTWRQTRTRLGPMPVELWAEAAGLANKHGISTVASNLRLGYLALKTRAEAVELEKIEAGKDAVQFVELVPKKKSFPSDNEMESCDHQIELTDPFGYRLRVQVPSNNPEVITNSIRQIWKMRACCR